MKDIHEVGGKNDQKQSKYGHLWVINFQDFFFQNWKSSDLEKIVFYVVNFHPIKIKTCLAPQNVHQNFTFVKFLNVVCRKMARNGPKMTIYKS